MEEWRSVAFTLHLTDTGRDEGGVEHAHILSDVNILTCAVQVDRALGIALLPVPQRALIINTAPVLSVEPGSGIPASQLPIPGQ
jgi:hypothetical protein